jgi:hypothetical protein
VSGPIDDAIAATDPGPTLAMVEVPINLTTTGRPAIVAVPEDITDAEVMELTAWMLRSLRGHIGANVRARSRLVVARGLPPS